MPKQMEKQVLNLNDAQQNMCNANLCKISDGKHNSFVGIRVISPKQCLLCPKEMNSHKFAIIQHIIYTFL